MMTPFSLNIKGRLMTYERPAVMAVVNLTPDSFYAASRTLDDDSRLADTVRRAVDEGADMIDCGAYSSRPGADDVSADEETRRLSHGLEVIRRVAPDAIVSVDTFRASVARRAVCDFGADIINDISGGSLDEAMFDTVAELSVPYVLMHMRGTPATMQSLTDYDGNVTAAVIADLAAKADRLAQAGVCDIIIDPGFGFSKTLEQNYRLLADLEAFKLLGRPLLVGVSRKSMATRLLGISADEALNATTVINTLAVERGASILRVHDVKACREAVSIIYDGLLPQTGQS